VLELAILGLLKEHPMHGYQLSRELGEALGGLWRVSYGSLYPTLRRLEKAGAVESVSTDPPAAGRRRKNVYRITATGEQMFLELLQESPHEGQAEDARFRIRLAFFRYLSPETRIRLLERRRQGLEERLVNLKIHLSESLDDYQRSLAEHGRAATESDIAWLNGLIQRERTMYGITAPVGERRRSKATLHRKERTA
jgi:DNA-binding PadR family transcriptional regulator